jgi:hypothetical protein
VLNRQLRPEPLQIRIGVRLVETNLIGSPTLMPKFGLHKHSL